MELAQRIYRNIMILDVYQRFLTPDELETYAVSHLSKPDYSGVILNLKNLDSIDSTGVGGIVTLYQILERSNRKLIICEMNENIRELFNIVSLDNILKICESEEVAINEFSQPQF